MEGFADSAFVPLHEQYIKIVEFEKMRKSTGVAETGPQEGGLDRSELKVVLDKALTGVDNLLSSTGEEHPSYCRLAGIKCSLLYEQAKMLVLAEKPGEAVELMNKALEGVVDHLLKPEITFIALRLMNHSAYLLSKSGEYSKSQKILETADQLSTEARSLNLDMYTAEDLFQSGNTITPSKETNKKFERLVTTNMQMLAFVCNKQGDFDQFAEYHHQALQRQLTMKEGDPIVWASKTARLASYFLSKNRFAEARHHLAAAFHVLEVFQEQMTTSPLEPLDNRWEDIHRKTAEIAKTWVKYGLLLFSLSRSRVCTMLYAESSHFLDQLWTSPYDEVPEECLVGTTNVEKDGEVLPEGDQATTSDQPATTGVDSQSPLIDGSTSKVPDSEESEEGDVNAASTPTPSDVATNEQAFPPDGQLRFSSFDLSEKEALITAELIETTEQARALFLYVHKWMNKAKSYYTLQDHPMEHINEILDLSELYRYVAFFEEDVESQYAVQKRRADTLETLNLVLREMRPQCYLSVSVELLRELAEAHMELMGLSLRRLCLVQDNSGSDVSSHKLEAIADLHSRLEQAGAELGQTAPVGDACGERADPKEDGDDCLHYFM